MYLTTGMDNYDNMEWYIKKTKEEFNDAKKYAEMAVKCKETNDPHGKMYYEMANQELGHAMNIHSIAVDFMNDWKAKGPIAEWIQSKWDKAGASYVRHVGKVKYMLAEFTK